MLLVLLYREAGECLESESLNNLFLIISVSFLSCAVIRGGSLGEKKRGLVTSEVTLTAQVPVLSLHGEPAQSQGEKICSHRKHQHQQKCRLKCSSCLLCVSVCNHACVLLTVMKKE